MSGRTGVIVRVGLPPALERLRRAHDPVAAAGMPAHVTILFPFLPADELDPSVRRRLAAAAGAVEPFTVRIGSRVGRFPGVVWLAPEPPEPFIELTTRIGATWPDYPPYEGAHDEIVPHLTIGNGDGPGLDRLEALVRRCPPFEVEVRAIEVVAERDGRWRLCWRIPLGVAGRRWAAA